MLDQKSGVEEVRPLNGHNNSSMWADVSHTVHNILDISYSLCWNEISHSSLPDTTHPHSPTYFLRLQWPSWDYSFALKWACFDVFLSLLNYEWTFFTPSKNQQRYMKELIEILWDSIISPVKGLGYYVWDFDLLENKTVFIDDYCCNNLSPIGNTVTFTYGDKKYTCLWYSKQAWPRKYRFETMWTMPKESFWVTYKEFELVSESWDDEKLPYPFRRKLDELQKTDEKISQMICWYTVTEIWKGEDSAKWGLYVIGINWQSFQWEIQLRWVLFELLKEVLKSEWEIFVPEVGARYMKELWDILPNDFMHHVVWVWYFIWDKDDTKSLEAALKRHRIKNLVPLNADMTFSDGVKEYSCIWYSQQRAGRTYYFSVTLSNLDYITLPWKSFELLQQLVANPWKIIKTERSDKWKISWIREAFGEDFMKSKRWEWVYIWSIQGSKDIEKWDKAKRKEKQEGSRKWIKILKQAAQKDLNPPQKKPVDISQNSVSGVQNTIPQDVLDFISWKGWYSDIQPPIKLSRASSNKPKQVKKRSTPKRKVPRHVSVDHTVVTKKTPIRKEKVITPWETVWFKKESPIIDFSWANTSLRWKGNTIIINQDISLELTTKEYLLVSELVELGKLWKCKKLTSSEVRAYQSIKLKCWKSIPKFIDEIDAPACVVSVWENSYVKKHDSIFSSAR